MLEAWERKDVTTRVNVKEIYPVALLRVSGSPASVAIVDYYDGLFGSGGKANTGITGRSGTRH